MPRVRIIHWKPEEAEPLIQSVRAGGFQADYSHDTEGPAVTRAIRENLPDAVVIDLSRLPSHGREMAVWLRGNKSTRSIPLVFVNGEQEKVDRIKSILPDAIFTTNSRLPAALKSACRKRAAEVVVPTPMMDRYRNKPVARKLGIEAESTVGLIDAPRDYASLIGALPENVEIIEDPDAVQNVTLWFVHDPEALVAGSRRMRAMAGKTKLWIAWRKGPGKPVTQKSIREMARDTGLAEYKLCAIGSRWSAMLFARKRT